MINARSVPPFSKLREQNDSPTAGLYARTYWPGSHKVCTIVETADVIYVNTGGLVVIWYCISTARSEYVYVYITPINFRPSWLVATRQKQRCSREPRKKKSCSIKTGSHRVFPQILPRINSFVIITCSVNFSFSLSFAPLTDYVWTFWSARTRRHLSDNMHPEILTHELRG